MANLFETTMAAASKWKPSTFDTDVVKAIDYVEGRQTSHLKRLLASRFPKTHQQLTPFPVPLYRHLVHQRANIYKVPPSREVVGNTGDVDDVATAELNAIYEAANANALLQQVEVMAEACGVAFGRVGYNGKQLVITPYLASLVNIVLDPAHPTDIYSAQALLAEVSTSDGNAASNDQKRYELWQRGDDGRWLCMLVGRDGVVYGADDVSYSVLPWVVMHRELPRGSVFVDVGDDDIAANDAVSVQATQLGLTISYQGHGQLTYDGPDLPDKIAIGPGVVMHSKDGTFGVLNHNAQIDSVREAIDSNIKRLVVFDGGSPVTVSTDPKYMSGAAQKVSQQPRLEQRQRKIPAMRVLERALFNIVVNTYPWGATKGINRDATLRWSPGLLENPVDDTEALALSEKRVMLGISDWPHEMVTLGLAHDLVDAQQRYKVDDESGALAVDPMTALNGAQVTAMLAVLQAAAAGELPRESAIAMIAAAFPLDVEQAVQILSNIGKGFVPTSVTNAERQLQNQVEV